jgi:hypothetical protein
MGALLLSGPRRARSAAAGLSLVIRSKLESKSLSRLSLVDGGNQTTGGARERWQGRAAAGVQVAVAGEIQIAGAGRRIWCTAWSAAVELRI